jgi:hypothetical protein
MALPALQQLIRLLVIVETDLANFFALLSSGARSGQVAACGAGQCSNLLKLRVRVDLKDADGSSGWSVCHVRRDVHVAVGLDVNEYRYAHDFPCGGAAGYK